MFKRVLLCYDSTPAGRRALRRGAELAVLLGAQVYVLSIVPGGVANAAVIAGAAGQACIVDETADFRKLLNESIDWLKARGVAFQRYPFVQDQELGIWTAPGGAIRVAWFKDPDGNVLSVTNA